MRGKLVKTTIGTLALVALFAIMAGAAVAVPASMTVTGGVIGYGGRGSNAWMQVVSGATITVQGAVPTATTGSDGTYALTLPFDPLSYAGTTVTATHRWYSTGHKLLGADDLQVQTFLLRVKGTTIKVTVKSGSKKVKGAKVECFGNSATSNASGVATLSGGGLKPQTSYTVKISKSGYHTLSFSVTSNPGHTLSFTKSISK